MPTEHELKDRITELEAENKRLLTAVQASIPTTMHHCQTCGNPRTGKECVYCQRDEARRDVARMVKAQTQDQQATKGNGV